MAIADFESSVAKQTEATLARIVAARDAIGAVIFGQDKVIEQTLVTLLAGGHGLLIGVPGLAKTKLVDTLGTVMGLDALRVQFTPDLMPTDILGAEVMEDGADGKRAFRFIKGPIFAQLLMADEINRASPRTQSALLQAMQEPIPCRRRNSTASSCRSTSFIPIARPNAASCSRRRAPPTPWRSPR
jgi:MoxR-like ATPase